MSSSNRMAVWCATCVVTVAALGLPAHVTGANLVFNGDFETDAGDFVSYPGYVANEDNPVEIVDWFGTGGRGINPFHPEDANTNPPNVPQWLGGSSRGINPVVPGGPDDAPFRDNGDNDTSAAFLQGTSFLQQDLAGLAVGTSYTLSLDYNARDCCGDFPQPTLSLNDNVVGDFPDPDLFPDGVVFPAGDGFPWYHSDFTFTASSSDLSLVISTQSELEGDSTLTVDNVSLMPTAGGPELINNGDFETDTDFFVVWPGYVGDDSQRAPFRDNGANKTHVAFMQGAATLEQDVQGLTVGEEYVMSFDYNARACCGDSPIPGLFLDREFIDDFPDPDLFPEGVVTPVGGNNPWYHFEMSFVADADTVTVTVESAPAQGGDATFVIDNVTIDRRVVGPIPLPGDADLNREFDQLDLIKVQVAAKYLTAQTATWGEGDWNGAPDPNSSFENPPAGDGFFNQLDIIAALGANIYLKGPYASIQGQGTPRDSNLIHVPEPSALSLVLVGLLASAALRRRGTSRRGVG